MKEHIYHSKITWTGNTGKGTHSYTSYERAHEISVTGKPAILASSDPSFRGDRGRYNPEELFLSSISSCHMLWYLHFCSEAGLIVVEYTDNAQGCMAESENGSGKFSAVILSPKVTLSSGSKLKKTGALISDRQQTVETAMMLHKKANEYCFIANSLNFIVEHRPEIQFDNNESYPAG